MLYVSVSSTLNCVYDITSSWANLKVFILVFMPFTLDGKDNFGPNVVIAYVPANPNPSMNNHMSETPPHISINIYMHFFYINIEKSFYMIKLKSQRFIYEGTKLPRK
jgi:hypothetical protein